MQISTLEKSPKLSEFCKEIRQEEDGISRYEVKGHDLELNPDKRLAIRGNKLNGDFAVNDEAEKYIANLVKIPITYFQKCEPELQSLSFAHRLRQIVPAEELLQVVLRNEEIVRIQKSNLNLLPALRLPIIDIVSNAIPENCNVNKEELRVIKYSWDDLFDISIISPELSKKIQVGDNVAFGINIILGRDGSLQIQNASFRLICLNGSVSRICSRNKHRLRRPTNKPDRQQKFFEKVKTYCYRCLATVGGQLSRAFEIKKYSLKSR